jgi:hypothetical protein
VQLKIICNGKIVKNKRETVVVVPKPIHHNLIGILNGANVRVKILCDRKEYYQTSNASSPTQSSARLGSGKGQTPLIGSMNGVDVRVRIMVGRKEYRNDLKTRSTPKKTWIDSIPFSLMDCGGNEVLERLLFLRPQRMHACARCQVAGRPMLTCRVLLGHSNPDYDWFTNMGGVFGVDGLLHMLRTGQEMMHVMEKSSESQGCCPDVKEGESQATNFDDETAVDPTEPFNKATTALALSQKILTEAQRYYEAPVRMGKDFVSTFPVDDDDGKEILLSAKGFVFIY